MIDHEGEEEDPVGLEENEPPCTNCGDVCGEHPAACAFKERYDHTTALCTALVGAALIAKHGIRYIDDLASLNRLLRAVREQIYEAGL